MESLPIVFIDADEDDQLLFRRIVSEVHPTNPVLTFDNGQAALDYLRTTSQTPFMIISEISLPGMSGLELRQLIDLDPLLRKRSIPFIFMTAPVERHLVEQAYELTIQGLFEKTNSYYSWKAQLQHIIGYWQDCLHPKRFDT